MARVFYDPHKKTGHFLEKLVYPVSLISPIMTVPQAYEIWVKKSVAGVSLATWGAYAVVSFMWLIYGTVHKEKPLAIANFLLFILDCSIVIGILTH